MKLNNFFYLYFLFFLLFGVILYDLIVKYGFSFIDEISVLIAFIASFNKKGQLKEYRYLFFIFIFYFINSLVNPHNILPAIINDTVQQIKPYIVFYSIYTLSEYFLFKDVQKKIICKLCLFFAVILLPFGFYFLFNPDEVLYNGWLHASRYSTMYCIFGLSYYLYSNKSKRNLFVMTLILSGGLLSMRSKYFGFYTLFILVFYFFKSRNSFNSSLLKRFIFILFALFIILFAVQDKLMFYFITGTTNVDESTMMARPLLYQKAYEILCDYPLFGTGFGSYATDASALYYSPLYSEYGLIFNNQIGEGLFISDTYYPVFAQFGIIGIILFVLFWAKRYEDCKHSYHLGFIQFNDFKICLLIIAFFLIESIADSTLTQNRGAFMMLLLALYTRGFKHKKLIKK